MSKLRDEERAKRKLQQENDILLEIGESGKKGDKAFKENVKLEEKISEVKKNIVLEKIEKKKNSTYYHQYLADILLQRIITVVNISLGWTVQTMATARGVVMEIKSPEGRIFRSAFRVTQDPFLDLNAIDNFALRVENTIERIQNEHLIYA